MAQWMKTMKQCYGWKWRRKSKKEKLLESKENTAAKPAMAARNEWRQRQRKRRDGVAAARSSWRAIESGEKPGNINKAWNRLAALAKKAKAASQLPSGSFR